MLKPKNIAIFVAAAIILLLVYIFFVKKSPEQPALVSTTPTGEVPINTPNTTIPTSLAGTEDFLSVLLNVRNIKLDDSIFSDPAFATLHDSSIVLTPDGTEGRVNPFAPIGIDGGGGPSTETQTAPPATTTSQPVSIPPKTKTKTSTSTSTTTNPPASSPAAPAPANSGSTSPQAGP